MRESPGRRLACETPGRVLGLMRGWSTPEVAVSLGSCPGRRLEGGDEIEVTADGFIGRAVLARCFPELGVQVEGHVALLVCNGSVGLRNNIRQQLG